MDKVVHIQTQISVQFAVLDGEGNALLQQPITATVGKFSNEAFQEAYTAIVAERDKLTAAIVNSETGSNHQDDNSNISNGKSKAVSPATVTEE